MGGRSVTPGQLKKFLGVRRSREAKMRACALSQRGDVEKRKEIRKFVGRVRERNPNWLTPKEGARVVNRLTRNKGRKGTEERADNSKKDSKKRKEGVIGEKGQ